VTGFVTALGNEGYYGAYTDKTTGTYYDKAAAGAQYQAGFEGLYAGAKSNAPDPSAIDVSSLIGGPGAARPVMGDVPNPNGWQSGAGGANAQTAAQQNDAFSTTTLSPAAIATQSFQQKQATYANDITQRINQMATTPPLRLLVNPRSFKNSLEKITSDGNWGRNGPIIEHWGEQLDKIEASGKIAAFYALDSNPPGGMTEGGPGITRMARNFSTSYQNLLSLYLIYRNNGGIWTQDYINPTSTRDNLAMMGSIYIFYDNILYVGGFDNFTITEADETPYSLEYSFTFTVRAWFEMDQQQDPRLGWQVPAGTIPVQNPNNTWMSSLGQGVASAYTTGVRAVTTTPGAVTGAISGALGT
jgi:hypothetical protein